MGRDLLKETLHAVNRVELNNRISLALARASATAPLRNIEPGNPLSWEFCGFSQHGEDGIVDYLCSCLSSSNRFFFEIGAADGIENCTAWLAYAKGYGGVWVEGNPTLSAMAREAVHGKNWAVHCINCFVDQDAVPKLLKMCPVSDPDVFSLDIDSIDYFIGKRVLELGIRPKICVVEYNSAFGPEQCLTVPYLRGFDRWTQQSDLYYGCSVGAWRQLFAKYGYQFVTVERSGTNAFFVDPGAFPTGFAKRIAGMSFRDNQGDQNSFTAPRRDESNDLVLPRREWQGQFSVLRKLPLVDVSVAEGSR